MTFLVSIFLGALSGYIAGKIMGSKTGLIRNIVMGLLGSMVGNAVFNAVGLRASGTLGVIIVSVVGACLCIFLGRKIFH